MMKSLLLGLTLGFTALTPVLMGASPAYEKYMKAYGEAESGKGAAVLPTIEEALSEAEKGGATTLEALEIAKQGGEIALNFSDYARAEDFTRRAISLHIKARGEKLIEGEPAEAQRLELMAFLREVLIASKQLDKARETHAECVRHLQSWGRVSGNDLWKTGEKPSFVGPLPMAAVARVMQHLQMDNRLYPEHGAANLELLKKYVETCPDYPAPAREAKLKELAAQENPEFQKYAP